MSWETKPLLLKNGLPIPQQFDPALDEWVEYTNEDIKALRDELALVKTELQTIKANQLSGDQKVTLSGANIVIAQVTAVQVTAGSTLAVMPDLDLSRFSKVYAMAHHNGSHSDDYAVTGRRLFPSGFSFTHAQRIDSDGESADADLILEITNGEFRTRSRVGYEMPCLCTRMTIFITNSSSNTNIFDVALMGVV